MYESYFHMHRRPFRATPQVTDYFPATVAEQARQTLARCIDRAEGAGLLIGPSGTGKTLLCLVLAEQFRETLRVVHLANGRYETPRALLQAILFELGRPYRKIEEGELRLSLIDYVTSAEHCPGGLLLLVDEAHALPPRQLEEIRMITNLVRDGLPRVRLVLAGGPELEERLANPKLEALNQRLAARCYLEAFTREETHDYVRAVLGAVADDSVSVFSADALDAVYAATDGIPRFVNQVCDHALVLAYAGGHNELDKWGIEEAWSDLQQLPTPWTETGPTTGDEDDEERGIIEFGCLDDAESLPRREISAEIEPEFEPAGAIGPETELSVDVAADPFGGEFDEEEIVIDRFATMDTVSGMTSTQVTCQEGRELSEQLEPFLVESDSPPLRVANSAEAETATDTNVEQSTTAPENDVLSPEPAQPAAEAVAHQVGELAVDQPAVITEDTNAEISAHAANENGSSENDYAGDGDLLVVEEEPESRACVSLESGGARRENYGQLFAKLRRG